MGDCVSCSRHARARLEVLRTREPLESGQQHLYVEEIIKLKLDTLINEGAMVLDRLAKRPEDPLRFAMASNRQCRISEDLVKNCNATLRELRKEIGSVYGIGEDGTPIKKKVDPSEPLAAEVKAVSTCVS